ncbi:YutD family protein [Alkalicoccus chagannorensis]|uniref:YutD family protein n=1 Tax=Alkalicoccus chagannorensis TaxID=427072 RepID=UPI00042396D6|nr:YutD family protein [Alkalicoccus chagannorensis]
MLKVQGHTYEVVENFRDGWSEEAFKERYSDILNKYDYIVGDWGYDQLRLKGFFEDHHRKSPQDAKISFLHEYLYEYCNFGCAYFVVRKVKQSHAKEEGKAEEHPEEPAQV